MLDTWSLLGCALPPPSSSCAPAVPLPLATETLRDCGSDVIGAKELSCEQEVKDRGSGRGKNRENCTDKKVRKKRGGGITERKQEETLALILPFN